MKKIINDTFIVPSMPKKIPCLFRCFFSHLIGDFAGYLVSFLMKVPAHKGCIPFPYALGKDQIPCRY